MPHRIIWSWYTGCWWVGCYIWYSEEGTGRGCSPPRPLFAVPNVTAPLPSTASVPITILQYNGLLLCGLMCLLKGQHTTAFHRSLAVSLPDLKLQLTLWTWRIDVEVVVSVSAIKEFCWSLTHQNISWLWRSRLWFYKSTNFQSSLSISVVR